MLTHKYHFQGTFLENGLIVTLTPIVNTRLKSGLFTGECYSRVFFLWVFGAVCLLREMKLVAVCLK